ncbi:FecR family protein [Deltaproteobacteria bacterium TL4]
MKNTKNFKAGFSLRKLKLIFCLCLLLFRVSPAWCASFQEEIVVTLVEKSALFRKSAADEWKPLKKGQALFPEYEVRTLEATRLVLQLNDGSEVRIAPESHLKINNSTNPQQGNFDFQLMMGRAWAKFRKNVERTARLILRTANAQIDIQGTSYDAIATNDATDVYVFSGKVNVSGSTQNQRDSFQNTGEIAGPQEIAPPQEVSLEEWHVIVDAFYHLSISNNQKPQTPQKFDLNEVNNEWVSWNLKQDSK